MKRDLDSIVRIAATVINSISFGLILWYKFVCCSENDSNLLIYAVIFLSVLIYFFIFHNSIKDKKKKFKTYISVEEGEHKPKEGIINSNIIDAFRNINIDEPTKSIIKDRVIKSIDLMGKEETIKNLITQHRLCSDNERFMSKLHGK